FRVAPSDVLEALKKHRVSVLEFRTDVDAEEFRQSTAIIDQRTGSTARRCVATSKTTRAHSPAGTRAPQTVQPRAARVHTAHVRTDRRSSVPGTWDDRAVTILAWRGRPWDCSIAFAAVPRRRPRRRRPLHPPRPAHRVSR